MTADQMRLARNILYTNTASKALRNRFLSNDPIVHEQEVNLTFTNMDAADHQDQDIVSALGMLGLHFAGAALVCSNGSDWLYIPIAHF